MNGKRPGGWVALAWRYYRDEKLLAVSADAELLWTHALAFTGEQETDGRIPAGALGLLASKLVGSPEAAAGELVGAGLWVETPLGWGFSGAWSRWQQTAEQVAASRARNADRVRQWRASNAPRNALPDAARDAPSVEGEGAVGTTAPPAPALNGFEIEDQEPAALPLVAPPPELAHRLDRIVQHLKGDQHEASQP